MSDVFGRRPLTFGGAFAADSAIMSVGVLGDAGTGFIIQTLSIQYQQPITRIYEVGSQYTYYVAGRPQGTANVAAVIGPGKLIATFFESIGDVCNAAGNDLTFGVQPGCLGSSYKYPGIQFIAKNIVLQSIGVSVAAQDMVINQQLSLFFTALLLCPATLYEPPPTADCSSI